MQRSLFDRQEALPRRPTKQDIAEAKERHPGMVLLFSINDSYQLYGDDAHMASDLLGLTLWPGVEPTVGFDRRDLEHYLRKLIKAGHRIAVCEQVQE
jgi:DNA mismatch repair protein MutS